MPSPALKSMGEKHDVSLKKMEEYWKHGKKQAEKYGMKGDDVYRYAMGIVKRRIGMANLKKTVKARLQSVN